MTNTSFFFLIFGLATGGSAGVILTSIFNPKLRQYKTLKKELDESNQQLTKQKQMLVKHFSHSAELLDKMAKDFRNLYQHIAENSNSILPDHDLNSPGYISIKKDEELINKNEERLSEEPPKDYSNRPSGLLKGKRNPGS